MSVINSRASSKSSTTRMVISGMASLPVDGCDRVVGAFRPPYHWCFPAEQKGKQTPQRESRDENRKSVVAPSGSALDARVPPHSNLIECQSDSYAVKQRDRQCRSRTFEIGRASCRERV